MSLKEALLDLLFPPKCPICGRSSDGEKDAPCPPCRQADFWISGPQAVVPGRAFVRCVCAGWYRGALKESMTRARTLLIVVGDDQVLARMAANDRQQRRYSGLRARLARTAEPAEPAPEQLQL